MKLVVGDADGRSVKVRKYAELLLPAGGMINGIITDENVMTRFFAQANNDYAMGKEPTLLVINNNSIQAKRLEVPAVSEDMMIAFIKREYSQYNDTDNDDNVYDYTLLAGRGPSGGAQILAVGVARELLETYRRTLVGAGFDLKKIDIGLNCQIKLAGFLPKLQQGSVILVLIDGRALSLTLFENGGYVVSNRYRLTHDENDPGLTDEIGGNISSMIQFNKTQKESAAITAAYIAGASVEQVDMLSSSLTYLGIDIQPLDMSDQIKLQDGAGPDGGVKFDSGRYLLNLSNLLKK
jgi:Tfp pilus assembly PilM family ATPase